MTETPTFKLACDIESSKSRRQGLMPERYGWALPQYHEQPEQCLGEQIVSYREREQNLCDYVCQTFDEHDLRSSPATRYQSWVLWSETDRKFLAGSGYELGMQWLTGEEGRGNRFEQATEINGRVIFRAAAAPELTRVSSVQDASCLNMSLPTLASIGTPAGSQPASQNDPWQDIRRWAPLTTQHDPLSTSMVTEDSARYTLRGTTLGRLRPLGRLAIAFSLLHVAAAVGTMRFEAGSGMIAGILSIWKANIVPTKEEPFIVLYHVIQATTIVALLTYAGFSTKRRTASVRQPFVLCSTMCGAALAALYPGRRFETCLEGFGALGFFLTGFVFDNLEDWWRTAWRSLDLIRPGGRRPVLPV